MICIGYVISLRWTPGSKHDPKGVNCVQVLGFLKAGLQEVNMILKVDYVQVIVFFLKLGFSL